MADKGKIFICLEGGLVQGVASTDLPDMEVIIIDHDLEGMDDEEAEEYQSRVDEFDQLGAAGTLRWQY